MSATTEEIVLKNNGPTKIARFPVPPKGGIVVLKGRNGIGKTKALSAIEYALTGRGEAPKVTDGELRGEVSAFGVTLTMGRSTRSSGELVVESLAGKLSISDLIDPGIKSPDAADAKRIKALVMLANVPVCADLFYPLVGGREQLESLVGSNALASDDLVVMAERIKRDLEAKARQEESQAEHAEGRARGGREAAAGTDTKAECDAAKLQGALEAAIRDESRLKAQKDASEKAALAARQAQDQLEDAEASYSGLTLTQAQTSEAEAKQAEAHAQGVVKAAEDAVTAAENALKKAKADLELAKAWLDSPRGARESATKAREQVEQHESTLKTWRDTIAASVPVAPTTEDLEATKSKVAEARNANDLGVLVREARKHLAEADKHADAAADHRKRAEQFRNAAKGTDDVLSQVIAQSGSPLRVEHGRLVLTTKRGNTYYHDLSVGERSRIAVDRAIDAAGGLEQAKRAVIILDQEIYEGLDPHNRRDLDRHAEDCGALIYTAEASEHDEIQAEVFAAN